MDVADCNFDRKPDLIVVDKSLNVSVLLADGVGRFYPATSLSMARAYLGVGAVAIAGGDFNRDRKPDLAMIGALGTSLVLLGDGVGSFTVKTITTPVGKASAAFPVQVGDWNGDRILDLIIDSDLEIGDGMGNFRSAAMLRKSGIPVASGDFNGDQKADLVLLGGGISLLLNQSL